MPRLHTNTMPRLTRSLSLRWGVQPQPELPAALLTDSFASITKSAQIPHVQVRNFSNLAKVESGRMIRGSIPYNVITDDLVGIRELYAPRCFSEGLTTGDVRALFNGDPNYILGRQSAGTLTVSDDRSGVHFTIDAPATSYADDLLTVMRRSDVDGVTVAFFIQECHKDSDSQGNLIRVIDRGQIVAISIATFSALRGAQVDVDRAIEGARAEGRVKGYAEASRNIKLQKRRESVASPARIEASRRGLLQLDRLTDEISRLKRS